MSETLFDAEQFEDERFSNPMVQKHGPGPGGAACGDCKYFRRMGSLNRPYDIRYRKCEVRGITHGPGTDHKAGFHACSLYEEADES
ncbi:hypothetical protein [Alicyclobacillus sp. SO9]|uniref:hypothetical protein n=1 Tax=Alicyclobacillus sp. SO9 TaxID=2665646 RepID=UPI0018E81480|nr:hypothetical protein [Alicyclobacillus sp. SO9]QQE80909.1 hypothetical protein GI364_11290 [Alicyclobacillus sp. SO9]